MYKESDLFFLQEKFLSHDALLSIPVKKRHLHYIVFMFLTDIFSEFPELMNDFLPLF